MKNPILRTKELYYEGNSQMIIVKKIAEEYKISSGEAGSYYGQVMDMMDAYDKAERFRYWNFLGGIFLLLLCLPGFFTVRIYMIIVLGSFAIALIKKGWNQINLYNETNKSNSSVDGLLDSSF